MDSVPLSFSKKQIAVGVLCAFLSPAAVLADEYDESILEEVVVTGTRIQRANLVSVSPITQVNAEDLRLAGITRVEDLLKNLPQLYSFQNSTASNEATGTATLNLRNLGSQRTLVLVDGRRLSQGSPFTAGSADINQIPGGLMDRVEVLTGGASAVYGSDAIAGVVNFFLMDDFEGVELDYQFSQYSHDNGNGRMRRLLEEGGYPVPTGTDRDGDTQDLSLIIGGNLEGGRGNVTVYATYRDIDPITQDSRDHSACSLQRWEGNYYCGGSRTIAEGLFTDFGLLPITQGLPGFDLMVQGNEFVPWDYRTYNYGPLNYFQRPDERYTLGALAHYAINEHVEAYTQLMFMDDQTVTQIAPSGSYFQTSTLSCGNPLLSQQQFDVLCGAYGLGPEDEQIAYIGRRNVEGGPRQEDIQHTSFRGVFGLRGDINETWRYDLYGQYAEVDLKSTYYEDILGTNMNRALDVVSDPDSGEPVCRSALSGADPTCVPWNIFEEGGVTQAALDYISAPVFFRGTTDQTVVSGYLAANLADYGLVSPFAETGIDIILGAEYREENLEFNPDKNAQSGDVLGFGYAVSPLDGGFDVTEYYTELSVPLVEGWSLAESLRLELGYRYSDYSPGDSEDTYKVASSWVPVNELRIRASYQRAVRAPNVSELFFIENLIGWWDGTDPCAGTTPERSFEDCAYTGVTEQQYGSIPATTNDPNQISSGLNMLVGGNAKLAPEESDTYSVGFLYEPRFVEGLSISLDWYEIEIDDAIDWIDAGVSLSGCLDSHNPELCRLVVREPARGSLWLSDEGYLDARGQNIGYIRTSGYDFNLDYVWDVGRWGSLLAQNLLTYLDEWEVQQHPSATVIDCRGIYGGLCSPMPEVRNHLRLTWNTPWQVTASVLWRYIDEVEAWNDDFEDLDSYNYFDFSLLWEPIDTVGLRLGVSNAFDEDPPVGVVGFPPWHNGNTYPGLYDALGQYWFAGVTVGF
jgi:outer membrane receptor protein involved in Fe transport